LLQRFLSLGLAPVPDATTVWLLRERLLKAKAIDTLFARFDAALTDGGYLAMGGKILMPPWCRSPSSLGSKEEKGPSKTVGSPENAGRTSQPSSARRIAIRPLGRP
jgi:IS5 family transposase